MAGARRFLRHLGRLDSRVATLNSWRVGDGVEEGDGLLAAGTRVGAFWIRGFLGEGAMGQVYLAHDATLGRRVALKVIKRSVMARHGVERFLEEARATASFNHPHIVTLHAVGEHDGRPYLALEYLDGESLRVQLRDGPLPVGEALRYCRAVAEAIAEAHRSGLVHADLKPDNIVLPRDGRVRVVDFGLAKLMGGAAHGASGTPAYMAPERWRGVPPTGAIDVWALGVTLHELITGGRPIPDEALRGLAFTTEELALPGLPEAPWAQIVRDCLALDPEARPTGEELVRRLTVPVELHAVPAGDDAGAHAVRRATMTTAHLAPGSMIRRAVRPGLLHPAAGELLEAANGSRDAAELRQEAAHWLARHIGAEVVLVASISDLTRDASGLIGLGPAWLDRLIEGFDRYGADFAQIAAISQRWGGFSRGRDTDLEDWTSRYGRTGFNDELVFPHGVVAGTAAVLVTRQAQVIAVMVGRERSSPRFTERECDLLNGILPILAMAEVVHASAPAGGIHHEVRYSDGLETRDERDEEGGRVGTYGSSRAAVRPTSGPQRWASCRPLDSRADPQNSRRGDSRRGGG
jgi:Protein kinase domain